MSLDTLLEAARYLELQELKEQQQQRKADAEASVTPPNAVRVTAAPQPSLLKTTPHSASVTSPSNVIAVNAIPTAGATSGTVKFKQELAPTIASQPQHRIIQNSFDIINPLIIDESSGEHKRKQPPLVFRSGTREVHNKLEKHRRAHLKECFDFLKKQLPITSDEKKTSNLSILHSALRYIQSLKKRERELEHEMERLAREKISAQQKLATLKKEILAQCDNVDFSKLLPDTPPALPTTSESKPPPVERVPIPALPRQQITPITSTNKDQQQQQPVQTTALSVVPVGYPINQGLVLQKLALVPKNITDLSPLVSTPTAAVAHFITTPQQLNGKVITMQTESSTDKSNFPLQMVPLVNAQYVVKPVVVVSTPSRPS